MGDSRHEIGLRDDDAIPIVDIVGSCLLSSRSPTLASQCSGKVLVQVEVYLSGDCQVVFELG